MLLTSIAHAERVLKFWSDIPWLAQDTETQAKAQWPDKESTLIHYRHVIKIFSFCYKGVSYSCPTNLISPQFPTIEQWAELFEWYFCELNPKVESVFHNANYDIRVMRHQGWPVFRRVWDTMISSWMANANVDKGLKSRAPFYGRHIRDTKTINFNDLQELSSYAEDDVVVTDEIYQMHTRGVVIRPKTLYYLNQDGKFTAPVPNPVGDFRLTIPTEVLSPFDRLFLRKQEFPVLISTIECEKNGVPLNAQKLVGIRAQMTKELAAVTKRIYRHAGKKINLNAAQQKVAVLQDLGLNLTRKTKAGKFSADFESMVGLRGQHPIVDDFIEYAKVEKLRSVYIGEKKGEGLEYYLNPKTQCIHPSLNTVGAVTGRFSCVSGATILCTSRGDFRIDRYVPEEGDLILTHRNRWKPILRKIYKGEDMMYRVLLENGNAINCTKEHRVFSANSWKSLAELTVGDTVSSYEYIQKGSKGSGDREEGSLNLPLSAASDYARNCASGGSDQPHRNVDSSGGAFSFSAESGTGAALLAQQDGEKKPYAGQEWITSPSLQRGSREREGLSAKEAGRALCSSSSARLSYSSGNEEASGRVRHSSHRREQTQQRAEQPLSGSQVRTPSAAYQNVRITEITALDSMGVWDIEVADDHSYQAQGFLNHNSSAPNMQNIPSRYDRYKLKDCFEAPKGQSLICMDYSQIELRVMALFSKDPLMTKVLNDPKGDIHQTTAENMDVPRDPVAKQCNFLLIFGGGGRVLAQRLRLEGHAISDDEGFALVDGFNETYTHVKPYRESQFDFHRQHGFVYLITGRRRVIENIDSSNRYELHMAETQLANNQIQGSAQDFMKALIVRCSIHRPNMDAQMHKFLDMPRDHELILRDYARKVEKFRRAFKLAKLRWRLQVHDEVLHTCDKHAAIDCAHHISEMMTWRHYFPPVTPMTVALRGDGGVGQTWGQAKKPTDPALKIHSPTVLL